jgi:hypothetical protein
MSRGAHKVGPELTPWAEPVAIAVLIAVGLVWLVVGTIYLHSRVGSVELGKDAGQFFVGP